MMSTVVSLVCVLLSLGWGGTGMAQDRSPEIVMDPSAVEGSAAPDTGQADRAAAERGQAGLTPLLGHLKMVSIPGGSFMMGCTTQHGECDDDDEEYPKHEVHVNDFEIGQYEVTQELWEAVMGENPSRFPDCAQCPVELVSWADVQGFLDELNARTGGGYRLPTEAEWEYAASGGQQSQYWYAEFPGPGGWEMTSRPHPVGQKGPNELGLYDMQGNVWEWVEDCWHDSYTGAPADGRAWVSGDCSKRVRRDINRIVSMAGYTESRGVLSTWERSSDVGFRVARTLIPVEATAAPDTGQVDRAAAERGQAGLTPLLLPLRMVFVPGGSFRMGCTREQRECAKNEYPVHEVEVNDFEIGQYEVTQALWMAVMDNGIFRENPSFFTNDGEEGRCVECPVESVSWDDVQEFLDKLNARTGGGYRLPTEAEWEYAARGGQQSRGYEYAGSHTPGAVAWYRRNSRERSHLVGQKQPNELGLYDMSGNVTEWVEDCWHDSYTGAPADGQAWVSGDCSKRVVRGGTWFYFPKTLRTASRARLPTDVRVSSGGFRLARTLTPVEATASLDTRQADRADAERRRQVRLNQLPDRLRMVSIPGGRFRMGCTREQRECANDEKPVHEVQVSAFEMGQYEVTQELWADVMMWDTSFFFMICAQCPVERVSWADAQRFLDELNARTGGGYRLPMEAEWEYAARGGQQSRGYQYAGSDDPGAVGWYEGNSGEEIHPVGHKKPNELGLYDMSGNVAEWVEDCWHRSYTGAPADGRAWASENSGDCSRRVRRGGSWSSAPWNLRAQYRGWNPSGDRSDYLGFRLARTLTP